MGIVTWIVWGVFVGAVARLLLPGEHKIGFLGTILLGIVGSVVGGILATTVLDIANADQFDFGSFLIAVATSTGLLALYGVYDKRFGSGRRERLDAKKRDGLPG